MRHYGAPKNGFESNWNVKLDLRILIETVQLKILKSFEAELRQKLELKKSRKKSKGTKNIWRQDQRKIWQKSPKKN